MTFEGPAYGPCEPFTTWEEIGACGTAPDINEAVHEIVIDVATEVVWALTGKRFSGECTRTIAPCWRQSCGCDPCSCTRKVRLDLTSVISIEEIVIDGETLDNTDGVAYRIEDWRWLVRLDGEPWPRCQGDWTVALTYGTAIPKSARRAASLLGFELAKQCAGAECGLDPQTTSYSREGVTVQLAVPDVLIAQGFTGLRTVDLLIASLGKGGSGSAWMWGPSSASEVTWDLAEVD